MLNLEGKKILILGASSSVGAAVALNLNQLGAKVVLSSKNDEKLNEILNTIGHDRHTKILFDLSDIQRVDELIKKSVLVDGVKLDGLVYAVNFAPYVGLNDTSLEILHQTMSLNFFAFIQAVKFFSDDLYHNLYSSVVVISDYSSINADAKQIAYGASKAALDSIMIPLAKELYVSKKIRINSIRPAVIDSDKALNKREEELLKMMRTGKIDPNILATQVAFFLSNASSGVYGRCFDVRGYLQ